MMRWILLLPPTIAAALLLYGMGALIYGLLLWHPVAHSGPLRLSENKTHICVGFTASYCDETVGPGSQFPNTGPWKPCGMDIIFSPPKLPVLLAPTEAAPCRDLHEDSPETPPVSAPTWHSRSGGRAHDVKASHP
jgi:hypothetical protein